MKQIIPCYKNWRIDDSDGSFWVTRSNLKTAEA